MNDECRQLDELLQQAELPAGDQRREHLDACPSCRALLDSFLFGQEAAGDEADPVEARTQLAKLLERELGTASPPPVRPRRSGIRFESIWVPVGLALVLLLLTQLPALLDKKYEAPAELQLRGDPTETGPMFDVLHSSKLERGGFKLRWTASAPGDSVALCLLGTDLVELVRIRAGVIDSLELIPANHLELADQARLWWVLTLYREGDAIGQSQPRPLNR